MSIPSGTTVSCMACFRYKELQLESGEETTFRKSRGIIGDFFTMMGDGLVPMGIMPGGRTGSGTNGAASCIIHWIMLVWLALTLATVIWRQHTRRRSEEYLYPDKNLAYAEFRSKED